MTATLKGRFVEAEPAGGEETTGFALEDVTVVEAEETSDADLEEATVNLDMPSAATGDKWVGQEVVVGGHFEEVPSGEESNRRVFVVEHIDEA